VLSYAYDGQLLKDVIWSGPVNGSVHWDFNTDFRISTEKVNSANAVTYGYDNDGLVTSVGSMTVGRELTTGRVSSVTLGSVAESVAYDAFGALATWESKYNGTTVLRFDYLRDNLGRIIQKSETSATGTKVFGYHYDLAGRLDEVRTDGTVTEVYTYDANGNRLTALGVSSATYDDQDRLLSYGDSTFTYTANGELLTKTDTGGTTTYDYDARGALRSVVLPSNTVIEYLLDGTGRRIGKKINGVVQKRWIYRDALAPVAELDGAGNLVSRFVYSGSRNVPEYIVRGGATHRVVADQVGSVRRVVDVATGTVVQAIEYDAFGRVTSDSNPAWQPFGFAGGMYESATGLVRFGRRDYDVSTGRWTAKDPLTFGGGGSDMYAYCDSDSVNRVDPGGLVYRSPECRWTTYSVPGHSDQACLNRLRECVKEVRRWWAQEGLCAPGCDEAGECSEEAILDFCDELHGGDTCWIPRETVQVCVPFL
jgi:RHS repeat-associated protein